MKKSILIFTLGIFFQLNCLSAQSFQIAPVQPQVGEKMVITYDPTGTNLEGEDVFGIAYVLELGEVPKAYDLTMNRAGNGYTTHFTTPANGQVVFFKFEDEYGQKIDKNNEEGYHTKIFKGDQPVEHAYIVSSSVYNSNYANLFGIKANGSKASEIFEKGITKSSDRFSKDYLQDYVSIVKMNKDEKGKTAIIEHVNSTLKKRKLTEKDMQGLSYAARMLGEEDLYNSIIEQIKDKFPEGNTSIFAKYAEFRELESLDEKLAMYKDAKSKYGANEDYENMIDNMERSIANAYGKKADFKNLYKYAGLLSSKNNEAGLYNSLAWGCSGESIDGEGHDMKEAQEMSMKSLKLIKEDMETLDSKLSAYTDRQWKRNLEYSYAMYSDTYALLAYKNGDVKDAFKYQKIACETNQMGDAVMNYRYAIFMEKEKGGEVAMEFLGDMISKGKANSDMKKQFTRLFKANVSVEQASEMYLTQLEDKARTHKIKEIKKEMISEKAPNFTLKNLKGEEVSLESLKGKVVVIDFWATWCGPCVSSFPGMQKAVTKYENSDDVEFVFIDTWENSETKTADAQKFIDKKGYTFNVLMDNDNKMVVDYGVSGIPTKFILDKEGNIRFSSSGFSGNDDALIEEITIVVEILRGSDSIGANARP